MSSQSPVNKKITSLSFSEQSSIKDDQKKHFRQFRSHEQKNRGNTDQKSMKEKASLNKMLSKSIDEQNELNKSKKGWFLWQVLLIDEKRTLTGIKVRIKCNMLPGDLYIVIRLSFTLEYFRLNGKLQQGTVFIELDELNFELNKAEKRMFQTELQKQMKPILSRTIYVQDGQEYKWVMQMFNVVEGILQGNNYQKRQKRSIEFLNRKQVLTKYILYHPPVCLAWSPKGLFCLTENKVPANKTSFIGNPLSFKLNIEVPKVSHLNTVNEQELTESSTQQPGTQMSLFSWDMSQELELFALNNHKRELSSYYKDNSRKDIESKKKLTSANSINNIANTNNGTNVNNTTFKTSDSMILKCSSKLTSTMKKIYQRHFSSKNDFQYEIARGQKLNVYFVLGENRRHQDQMLYLMERINIQRLRPPIEVILSHMLGSHPNLLSAQQGQTLNTVKYFVISQLFRQQTSLKSSTYQFNLSTCLKSIMVENQYHSIELQKYLTQCFRQIGLNNAKLKFNIYQLGSYLYFDEYKSQKILMKLLQQYEYHYELNFKNQKQVRFILQSKNIQRIKKHIKIKNIVKFSPLKQDWLLTDDYRKQFVQTILPLLIIRDRNYEDFYYKQLERILATNQKIIKFYKNLAQIIKKIEQQRHEFIKQLVNEFSLYEKNKKTKEQMNQVRRQFTIYCQKCQKPNKTYEIDEAQKLRICNRCLETTNKKM